MQPEEDYTKTTFCIPFDPSEHINKDDSNLLPSTSYPERDLPNGERMRFEAYQKAWKKCLTRITEIVQNLQRHTTEAVVKEVRSSYAKAFPALPYPELPVVSLVNPALGTTLIDNICRSLENSTHEMTEDGTSHVTCSIIHLYPADFPSIAVGMRAIVSGFIEKAVDLEQSKRKTSASLANYDIGTLEAWYNFWSDSRDEPQRPNLCVLLHNFEQIDPNVLQEIFYICSKALPRLPIVFILDMSSPLSNFINLVYPRLTLSCLRIRKFAAPSGEAVLREIWLKTFFDVDFDPDIMLGPTILEYLQDYFTRHNASVDAILTILQLAHLKHFTSEPLRLLVYETPDHSFSEPSVFLDALRHRLRLSQSASRGSGEPMDVDETEPQTPEEVITTVNKARDDFYQHSRNLRIGFGIIQRVQIVLEKHEHKGLGWAVGSGQSTGLFEALLDLLRDRSERDINQLGKLTKRFNAIELREVLDELSSYFFNMPAHIRSQEQETRSHLTLLRSQIPRGSDDQDLEVLRAVAQRFSDWLMEYTSRKLVPLEEACLWDVWYTGQTPPAAELLNPSVRASIIAGLLRPYDFAEDLSHTGRNPPNSKSLWKLPDTSILFKRYLDSGKMINVYDWFEAFKSVLDLQRIQPREIEADLPTPTSSPRKQGKQAKKSGKGRQKEAAPMTEGEEERWKTEVHARFMRALHELDYLGFIKHTGRKADHVFRTTFEIDDDGDGKDEV